MFGVSDLGGWVEIFIISSEEEYKMNIRFGLEHADKFQKKMALLAGYSGVHMSSQLPREAQMRGLWSRSVHA
jgi:hypothetical protein